MVSYSFTSEELHEALVLWMKGKIQSGDFISVQQTRFAGESIIDFFENSISLHEPQVTLDFSKEEDRNRWQ